MKFSPQSKSRSPTEADVILTTNLVNEARISYQRNATIDTEPSPFTDSSVGITSLTAAAGVTPNYDNLSYFTVGSGSGGFSFGPHYFFNGNFPKTSMNGRTRFPGRMESTRSGRALRPSAFSFREATPATRAEIPHSFLWGLPDRTGRMRDRRGQCRMQWEHIKQPFHRGKFSASPTASFSYAIRVLDLDGFVQDDFKVTSHLTVNLGLRWEYDGLPNVTNGSSVTIYQAWRRRVRCPQLLPRAHWLASSFPGTTLVPLWTD